jgi:hypothetical protein
MYKYVVITVLLLTTAAAWAMTGGPLFTVAPQASSMAIEATRTQLKITSPSSNEDVTALSERLGLTARYGLLPGVDMSATLGTATLNFNQLAGGYSDFHAPWSIAWGASLRAGYPSVPKTYQIMAAVDYWGFQPKGSTSNGVKDINSKYLWNEMTPSIVAGVRLASLMPYVGVTKPFLLGRREVSVDFQGAPFPAASGNDTYRDGKQPLRGLAGLEWRLPQGYSVGAEAATTSGGDWTVTINVAQMIK